jgi:hypothetical protein
VGEFRLHEHRDRRFAGESHPISVDFIADPDDPNHNSRVIHLDGKVLGPLSDQSPHLPVGTTATASLHTPPGAAAIATLSDGETFKIGTLKNYPHALTDFRGLETALTIDRLAIRGKAPIFVARLDGQILGEIKDKDSKALLSKCGLLRERIEIAVKLDRESPSIVHLSVDPATVVYPDRQLHDRARSTPERGGELLPTVWCRSDDGLTLAVDRRNRGNLADFLDRHHLPFSPVEDAALEREADYTVVRFESLPEPVYDKLLAKFGEPLNEDEYLRRVEGIVNAPSGAKRCCKQNEPVPDTALTPSGEKGADDGKEGTLETVQPPSIPSPPVEPVSESLETDSRTAPAIAPDTAKTVSTFEPRHLQDERTVTVAPILVDLLHCKLTTEYRGERYSVLLDPESQILSCYRAETRQLMMQARHEESAAGDERWKSLPVLLDDPQQPDIRPEDLDFLTRDLAPKLAALHERHSRIYADALAGLDDPEYLSPIERDSLIAVSLLEKGRTLEEVALTVNRSETFESLSPGAAIDYRRLILENAVELHREALEARLEDEIDR